MTAPAPGPEIPWGVWAVIIGIAATLIGWILKRVLWDPIAELKAAQADFVTQTEVDMHVETIKNEIAALRRERGEGEDRINRNIDGMRRENNAQRNEVRQDIRALVQRVDTAMQQQARH